MLILRTLGGGTQGPAHLIYVLCLSLAVPGPLNDLTEGVLLQPSVGSFRGPRTEGPAHLIYILCLWLAVPPHWGSHDFE